MVVKDIPNWEVALAESLRHQGLDQDAKPQSLNQSFAIIGYAMYLLLLSKQTKYGKDNILEFGHQGLIIRSNDKVKRLISGHFKGADLGEEGTIESWGDILGYAALGLALEKGWFTLPLMPED